MLSVFYQCFLSYDQFQNFIRYTDIQTDIMSVWGFRMRDKWTMGSLKMNSKSISS